MLFRVRNGVWPGSSSGLCHFGSDWDLSDAIWRRPFERRLTVSKPGIRRTGQVMWLANRNAPWQNAGRTTCNFLFG